MTEPFQHAAVANAFDAYPDVIRTKLMHLRQLIFRTASDTEGVGQLEETLKWGQPSYLTPQTRSGTTIRIDRIKSEPDQYGMFVHCQTSLIATYRELFGNVLRYDGNRCIKLDVRDDPPQHALQRCIGLALTYHLFKRRDCLPF